jgi:uncharacterized protein (DUF2252 family)
VARSSSRSSERTAAGKSCRSETPRSSHAKWEPVDDRADPISLLEQQAAERVAELVPIRYGRMSASPFAFYRGAAAVMAPDLATTPTTGIQVQLCGDAHLANFGGFASPERELLFDLNDFDETHPGPWEWDVKRLAASFAVAARDNGFEQAERVAIVHGLVRSYRESMRKFAGMSALDVWYARAAVDDLQQLVGPKVKPKQAKRFDAVVARGRRKDSARAFAKLAVQDNGSARIRAEPPLIVPIVDLLDDEGARRLELAAGKLLESYLHSLEPDRRRLVERYRYADLARKVVGVGSVGTRCWVILLLERASGDPLFLQVKEAQRSVVEPFTGASGFSNQGQRVVEGQRLMQAASDIFLGWLRLPGEADELELNDFYVRQLWDSKISVDVTAMAPADMILYSRLCSWTLARAHARSGDPIEIAGYLGSSDVFDRAIADFAEAYAEQNARDHAALLEAIASGRVKAEVDL